MHLQWPSYLEVLGFVTGALCVLLGIYENIWNWPIGIANNLFFLVLFWRSGIYADSGLQLFYLAVALYGWWNWLYGGEQHGRRQVSRTGATEGLVLLVLTAVATFGLHWLLKSHTSSQVPWGDATTTALSLAAQYMLGRKLLENWIVWIVADVIYIGLYFYKGLALTGILYFIFIIMCIAGFARWRRSLPLAALSGAPAA